jgi:hypothetical protein
MNKLLLTLLAIALVGCTPSYEDESTAFSALPPELKDCKIFSIRGSNGNRLYITKCPQYISTTNPGKNSIHTTLVTEPVKEIPDTVIVDGVEYKR